MIAGRTKAMWNRSEEIMGYTVSNMGAFERLNSTMGYENGLVAMYDDEEAYAEMFLKRFQLSADSTVSDVQLFSGLTDAVRASCSLEGAKSIQRRKVMAHGICEFS